MYKGKIVHYQYELDGRIIRSVDNEIIKRYTIKDAKRDAWMFSNGLPMNIIKITRELAHTVNAKLMG